MLDDIERAIAMYIERRLEHATARGVRLSRTARSRVATIVKGAAKRSAEGLKTITEVLREELFALGRAEGVFEAALLGRMLDQSVAAPTQASMWDVLLREPIEGGETFRQKAGRIARGHREAVERGVRLGVALGETAGQIRSRVFGTSTARHLDGMTARTRRSIDSFVQSAVTRAISAGRELVYSAVGRVIKAVQWTAILDHKVCPVCGDLHGKMFKINEGPRPPAHPSCRCSVQVVVRGFAEPEVEDFSTWMRRQPAGVQDEVLGPTRARLWRARKLEISEFVNDRQRMITLDDLSRRGDIDLGEAA